MTSASGKLHKVKVNDHFFWQITWGVCQVMPGNDKKIVYNCMGAPYYLYYFLKYPSNFSWHEGSFINEGVLRNTHEIEQALALHKILDLLMNVQIYPPKEFIWHFATKMI